MDTFRDSYFNVAWDLTNKHLRGTFWGKQYDTGRGFAVTVINGGQVVSPTTEVLRLKWEKPDNTSGYVQATIINGKFVIENIDQMFTVAGSVRADLELSVGGKFVASITFYVSVEKAVAVDAIESSSQFTALQEALANVDDVQAQVDAVIANATVDSEVILARGTEPTLGARLDGNDAQLAENTNLLNDAIDGSIQAVLESELVATDIANKLNAKETEYTPRLTSAEAKINDLATQPFSRKTDKVRNIVTFYMDDALIGDYTLMLPIAQRQNIPVTIAAVSGRSGGLVLTYEQLIELQDVYGWEIASHTHNHVIATETDDATLDYEYRYAKEYFESMGLNISHICFPNGLYNETAMQIARKYYDFAMSSDQDKNKTPIRTYNIKRILTNNNTLEKLKTMVDNMNNEWYIFYSHSDANFTVEEQNKMEDLIAYIKTKGIEIMNATPAFEIFKNRIDVGDEFNDNAYFHVGADGNVGTYDSVVKFQGVNPSITNDTPITDFENGKINIAVFTGTSTNGLPFGVNPNTAIGTLYTYRHGKNQPTNYQKFELYNGNEVGYRYLNGDNTWTNWVIYKPVPKTPVPSEVTDETPLSYFTTNEVTIINFSQNASTFRNGEAGTLIVNRKGGIQNQIWIKYNSTERFIRYFASGIWQPWISLGYFKKSVSVPFGIIPANSTVTIEVLLAEAKATHGLSANFRLATLPDGLLVESYIIVDGTLTIRATNIKSTDLTVGNRSCYVTLF